MSQAGCHRLQVATKRREPRREATHPTLMRAHAWPAHHHPARPVVGCTRPRTPPGTQRGWGVRRGAQLSQHRPARLSKGACCVRESMGQSIDSQLRIAHSEFDSHFPLGDQVLSSLAKQRIACMGWRHPHWTLDAVHQQQEEAEEEGGSPGPSTRGKRRQPDRFQPGGSAQN